MRGCKAQVAGAALKSGKHPPTSFRGVLGVGEGWGVWSRDPGSLPTLSPQQKEQESLQLKQEVEMLQAQKQELLRSPSLGENCIAGLKERLWKLESSALEHEKVQNQQENTIKQLEQVGKSCPE